VLTLYPTRADKAHYHISLVKHPASSPVVYTTLDSRGLSESQIDAFAFKWARDQIISPLEQLADLAKENPTTPKPFTPSYPAQTQRDYDAWVKKCASDAGKPWYKRKDRRCKRLDHDMIEGGRVKSRYDVEEVVKPESSATKVRLGGPNRPFHARTQSEKTRSSSSGLVTTGPELLIAQAINTFRRTQPKGDRGFSVPTSPGPLINAGMPKKEALILVTRAARKFYPDVPAATLLSAPLLTKMKQVLGPLVVESIELVSGGPSHQLQVEGRDGFVEEVSVREGGIEAKKARGQVLIDANGIERSYGAWKKSVITTRTTPTSPGFYRREHDDPEFLEALFNQRLSKQLRTLARAWKSPNFVLEVIFAPGGEELETPFSLPEATREHSKLKGFEALPSPADYKSLQNVSLADLPSLLVRLARRKKRKGRQLNLLSNPDSTRANQNPMTETPENSLLQLVFDKAFSDNPTLVPVPGKPGRVYWPVTKLSTVGGAKTRVPLGLKDVDAAQAGTWLNRAAGARRHPVRSISVPNSTLKENPMSNNDYWMRQYQQGPFGPESDIPTARRNAKGKGRKVRKARKAMSPERKALLTSVGTRTQQILAQDPSCDMSYAMSVAWDEVKKREMSRTRPGRAVSNPWFQGPLYLPDNPVREALVPASYDWQDSTEVRSALVPGPYGRANPKGRRNNRHSQFEHSPDTDMWEHHPNYEQFRGQFGVNEAWTRGVQPYGRRNPSGGLTTARFPGECIVCGNDIERGQQIGDSGMRGPKGGKKMAHAHCI
jgi:hypothetical protein